MAALNNGDKKPLYRKVNTKARHVHHNHGGDFKNFRNGGSAIGMRRGIQRGLDYTPLFRFLLSKVGCDWDVVHSEAVSRLDKEEPIFWMVSKSLHSSNEVVRLGESTFFSGLFVDESRVLRVTNPEINETSLAPQCKCCTHTFNGVVFSKTFAS